MGSSPRTNCCHVLSPAVTSSWTDDVGSFSIPSSLFCCPGSQSPKKHCLATTTSIIILSCRKLYYFSSKLRSCLLRDFLWKDTVIWKWIKSFLVSPSTEQESPASNKMWGKWEIAANNLWTTGLSTRLCKILRLPLNDHCGGRGETRGNGKLLSCPN